MWEWDGSWTRKYRQVDPKVLDTNATSSPLTLLLLRSLLLVRSHSDLVETNTNSKRSGHVEAAASPYRVRSLNQPDHARH